MGREQSTNIAEPKRLRWIATKDQRVLADRVEVADSFFKRLIGLQFRRQMPAEEALWLSGCRSVHTAWMRFPIDVYFLDESLRIVDIRCDVSPWRIARPSTRGKSARHVVEMRSSSSLVGERIGLQTVFEHTQATFS